MEGSVLRAGYPVQVESGSQSRFVEMNKHHPSKPRDVGVFRIGPSHATS
jgi:hypothetical protein